MHKFLTPVFACGLAVTTLITPISIPERAIAQPASPLNFGSFTALDVLPDSGSWQQYAMTDGSQAIDMRLVWLEQQTVSGIPHQRLETQMTMGSDRMVSQVLFALGETDSPLAEMVVKVGNEPAMLLPGELLAMGMASMVGMDDASSSSPSGSPVLVGTEQITVGAGTFSTDVYEYTTNDGERYRTYIDSSVPAVVLMEGPQTRLELMGLGDNATSAITETPISIQEMMQSN